MCFFIVRTCIDVMKRSVPKVSGISEDPLLPFFLPLSACRLPFQNLLCLVLAATAAAVHLCSNDVQKETTAPNREISTILLDCFVCLTIAPVIFRVSRKTDKWLDVNIAVMSDTKD